MKDDKGLYYYPSPADPRTRVYVRQGQGGIEFRLWREEHPQVWDKHGWLSYDVVAAASEQYKERGVAADPLVLYDRNVARALLKDEELKNSGRRPG